MKTQLFTLATILVFALSVSAKESNLDRPDNVTANNLFHSAEAVEMPLSIENWMTDDQMWKAASEELFNIETSSEEELTIESWMTDNELWKNESKKVSLYNEITIGNHTYLMVTSKKVNEAPLEIEKWMTDDRQWSL